MSGWVSEVTVLPSVLSVCVELSVGAGEVTPVTSVDTAGELHSVAGEEMSASVVLCAGDVGSVDVISGSVVSGSVVSGGVVDGEVGSVDVISGSVSEGVVGGGSVDVISGSVVSRGVVGGDVGSVEVMSGSVVCCCVVGGDVGTVGVVGGTQLLYQLQSLVNTEAHFNVSGSNHAPSQSLEEKITRSPNFSL